jgi:thiopeptide-type bacteriocin biosynthesis protein
LVGLLLKAACGWATQLIARGECRRFGFDSYEREIERYGGEAGLEVAESVFGADSTCVTGLLAGHARDDTLDLETIAVLAVDDLLAGVGLSEEERLDWYRERASLSPDDGQDYRRRQERLRHLLGAPEALSTEADVGWVSDILAARRRALAPIPAQLEQLRAGGTLTQSRDALCRSYVHLHCNRLLGPDGPDEARVLALLRRTRESLARAPVRRAVGQSA